MNKKKVPWYIWLSILAWMLLLVETSIRMNRAKPKRKFRNARYDYSVLELSFVAISISSIFGWVFFTVILYVITNILLMNFDNLLVAFLGLTPFLNIYFFGVYITYRLWKWRQEKIPHLL